MHWSRKAYLFFQIIVMTVEGNDYWLSETLHVADVAVQILQALRQSCGVRLLDVLKIYTSVHLQSLGGSYDHH